MPRKILALAAGPVSLLVDALLAVLLPPLCALCRSRRPEGGSAFCTGCLGGFTPLWEPFCSVCGVPFDGAGPSHPCGRCLSDPPPFTDLRAWGLYRGSLLEAVHAFKYRKALCLREGLERLALQAFDRHWGAAHFSAAVPVPCHLSTLRRRGFDLPALLSRRLSHARDIPWRPRALAKVRKTADLVGLGIRERAEAVAGAYDAAEGLQGRVLLVDDVATSTSTARACAEACLSAGAAEVSVLVLARTPLLT